MGQAIYQARIDQTEEIIPLSSKSNIYIVLLQKGSEFITRRIIAF
jgi:hypothetical protein